MSVSISPSPVEFDSADPVDGEDFAGGASDDGDEELDEEIENSSKGKSVAKSKEPPPRPEILVDRTVIHESLIRNSIHRELKYYFDPTRVPAEDQIDLNEVTSLVLSFRGIYSIENLGGFTRLTRLQLDNNQIERISGLSTLRSLTWLDLSFNSIDRITGLECLTELTDLSLHGNKISRLDGIENLTKLSVLSVGNNQINDLGAIRALRQFKSLKLLSLKGNPVSLLDDYHNTVFAYLTSLKYLDYVLIEPAQFARARDSKLDVLLLLEQKEKQDAIEEKAKELKKSEEAKLVAANLEGISSLFNEMIAADSEQNKVKLLPGYQSLFNQYQWQFQEVIQDFCRDILARSTLKSQELAAFEQVADQINREAEKESRDRIGEFDKRKKIIFKEFEQWMEGNSKPPVDPTESLKQLKIELASGTDDLMEIEMLLVERMNGILEEFERAYLKCVSDNVVRIGSCFRTLMDVSNKHLNACYDLSHTLLDRFARDELAVQEDVDVRAILSDKDVLNNAISSSHENQDAKILAIEDIIREREENTGKGLVKEFRKKEFLRNRKRVAEIYEFRAREEAAIDEKLENEENDR